MVVNHAHKFVINNQDIISRPEGGKSGKDQKIENLLSKFEPETNILDRRILYEVTRMRIKEDEF